MKTIESIILGTTLTLGALSIQGCPNDSPCQGMSSSATNTKGNFSTPLYENTSKAYGSSTAANSSEPTCRESCSYDSKVGCCWCPD